MVYGCDGRAPELTSDRDAIVRPLAVTRCDLDLSIVYGVTDWAWEGGFGLGHETVGIVTDVGDGVSSFKPGDRVIVPFQISCGECPTCLRGYTSACATVPNRACYGVAPLCGVDFGGSILDLIRVLFADHMLVACPNEVSDIAAAGIADNVSDAFRLVAPALAASPGADVLVIGGLAQGIGLYAADAARALGAKTVVYLDKSPDRLHIAKSLGVTVVEGASWAADIPGAPFPVTVDASGVPDGLTLAIRSTQHAGIINAAYGGLEPTIEVPLREMYGIGMSLNVSRAELRMEMPKVIEHVRCGHIHPDKVITHVVNFDEAVEAIFGPTIKVVFMNK